MTLIHKWFAKIFGYSWNQCPICGKYFGGHQITLKAKYVVVDGQRQTVCPKGECNSKAISRNLKQWYVR